MDCRFIIYRSTTWVAYLLVVTTKSTLFGFLTPCLPVITRDDESTSWMRPNDILISPDLGDGFRGPGGVGLGGGDGGRPSSSPFGGGGGSRRWSRMVPPFRPTKTLRPRGPSSWASSSGRSAAFSRRTTANITSRFSTYMVIVICFYRKVKIKYSVSQNTPRSFIFNNSVKKNNWF